VTLRQTRIYLLLGITLSVTIGIACAVGTLSAVRESSLFAIPCVLVGAMAGHVGYDYIKRLRNPPLATFTPLGVTNEYGQSFGWSQITKIYKFAGVLFVRDQGGLGCTSRSRRSR
jgi:hypothetical protein